jgi:hypothetical protein
MKHGTRHEHRIRHVLDMCFNTNNYLNTEVHINYNESLHSIQEQCQAMLLTMNHLAHVQEMAQTINAASTNATNAMLTITPTIKILLGSDFVANHHLKTVTNELVKTTKTDIERNVYNLTKQIAYKMKATPEAGTEEEIQTACIIVDAYLKHNATKQPFTHPNTHFLFRRPKEEILKKNMKT